MHGRTVRNPGGGGGGLDGRSGDGLSINGVTHSALCGYCEPGRQCSDGRSTPGRTEDDG